MRPGWKRKLAPFAALSLAASLVVLLAWSQMPASLSALDLMASDAMSAARPLRSPPEDVIIVAIDDKSVDELGRWPWPRSTIAALVRALSPARTVAFDMVFSEEVAPASDAELGTAVAGAGNIVLGFLFRDGSASMPMPEAEAQLGRSSIKFLEFSGAGLPGRASSFAGVEPNRPVIGRGAAGFGFINIAPGPDGVYREMKLVYRWGRSVYPSLVVEALRRHLSTEVMLNIAERGIDDLFIGPVSVPVGGDGALALDFYGPSGSFVTYPAADVIAGRVPASAFRDRLVFVGVTAGGGIYGVRPTPVDPLMPGVELHATAAANVLEGRHIVRDARTKAFDIFLVFLLPLTAAIALTFVRRTLTSLAVFIALMAALAAGGFLLFSLFSVMVGVLYPALSLLGAYLMCEAYRKLVVEKKSRHLRDAFSASLSQKRVAEIIEEPERLRLGGEKRVVTVLSAGVSGLAALAEEREPEELFLLLNRYLGSMREIVLAEGGLLDKSAAEAITALFNAPLELEGHPVRACAAALEMAQRLAELNGEGCFGLSMRVGLATGPAVVGKIGAPPRFGYTALGDTVRLASSLEGMNKLYGSSIIVSDSTRARAADSFDFRELDLVRVEGVPAPVAVFELLGPKGAKSGLIDEFSIALGLYRKRDFSGAEEIFRRLSDAGDGPSGHYVERCAACISSPPGKGWDGVYAPEGRRD
ncbi:MAG: adenylate/guanylate cyclase domain-containing protein [Thermodesulfobacteriota bacterium]|nr:MAG: adenylate/guanylate cyclase domain-containing protein [Thermodesulfobacteriota bacterium]